MVNARKEIKTIKKNVRNQSKTADARKKIQNRKKCKRPKQNG